MLTDWHKSRAMPESVGQSNTDGRGPPLAGAALVLLALIGSAAWVRAGTKSTGFLRERVADPGVYRLSDLFGVATAIGVVLLVRAASRGWTIPAAGSSPRWPVAPPPA